MIPLIGTTATAWLIAVFLNRRIPLLRRLQLPESLLAGLMLLLVGPQGAGWLPPAFYDDWKAWPGILIAFLFSGLILEPGVRSAKRRTRFVLAQASYVWMLAFLQLGIGYGICAFFASPEERLFAHIIELSWLGGPGSASAFLPISERLGNRTAGELSLAAATLGLLWGSASGLLLAAYHRRKLPIGIEATRSGPFGEVDGTETNGTAEESSIIVSFLLPVLPVLAAFLLREGMGNLAITLVSDDAGGTAARVIQDLPLFFIVIPIAYGARAYFARHLRAAGSAGIRLFHELSLEGLVTSAMATLSLITLRENTGMLLLFTASAAILSLLCHFFLSPRLLPHHPDLSLINYGMATGTTALGLMLLRTYRVRPDVRALEIYGIATPLSAPFIGGGMISLLVLPELTVRIPPPLMLFFMLIGALVAGGAAYLFRGRASSEIP